MRLLLKTFVLLLTMSIMISWAGNNGYVPLNSLSPLEASQSQHVLHTNQGNTEDSTVYGNIAENELSYEELSALVEIDDEDLARRYVDAKPVFRNKIINVIKSNFDSKRRLNKYVTKEWLRIYNGRLVRSKFGTLHLLENKSDIYSLSNYLYIWSPKVSFPIDQLEEITTIETYHSYGAPSLFKPSIREVLAQIPRELLGKKIYFEVSLPGTETLDGQKYMSLGFHTARTTFYKLKN